MQKKLMIIYDTQTLIFKCWKTIEIIANPTFDMSEKTITNAVFKCTLLAIVLPFTIKAVSFLV